MQMHLKSPAVPEGQQAQGSVAVSQKSSMHRSCELNSEELALKSDLQRQSLPCCKIGNCQYIRLNFSYTTELILRAINSLNVAKDADA